MALALAAAPGATAYSDNGNPPISSTPAAGDPLHPLLATKLHPPCPRAKLVSRPHLVKRLQEGIAGPLTLLSAPAGYGKTTLLAQWLAESATPVAWLSLEPQDNDPVRFLTYLLAALQTHSPDPDMHILALLQAPQSTPLERALVVLTNNLMNRQREDFALVLDDCQVIEASPIHHALAFLLDHLPPQMHLVLATRADPPLALARLRARGQLVELRATDLRLSSSESETFLHTVMGLDLPPEAILALERRTEGWVAGLQLAALSLRGRDDVPTFLAAFTGSHRFVLDYLSEEVLSRLLKKLSGAQISAEEIRLLTNRRGKQRAGQQQEKAERACACPAAIAPRAEQARQPMLVGLDGGWVCSREQRGGMEGKVGVVCSQVEDLPMPTYSTTFSWSERGPRRPPRPRHRLTQRRYVATFGPSQQLGQQAEAAARALCPEPTRPVVVIADGANWIKKEQERHFPQATCILDWAHLLDWLEAFQKGYMVAHTGFEPVIPALRGRCPRPLDECASVCFLAFFNRFATTLILPVSKRVVNSIFILAADIYAGRCKSTWKGLPL